MFITLITLPPPYKMKKSKRLTHKLTIFLKIIILILPPLIISMLLFTNIEVPFIAEDKGEVYNIEIDFNKLDKPSKLNSLRKIFQVPFNFDYYEIILEDDCSTSIEIPSKEVTFVFNINRQNYVLHQCGEESIGFIRSTDYFTYPKQMTTNINIPPKESRIFRKPDIKIFAKPYFWDVIVQYSLVFLAWLGFYSLIVHAVRYIKEKKFF